MPKKRLKTCKTRWFSFDKSVKAALNGYESILQCLHLMESDATATGLLRKLQSAKFVGVLHILRNILPIFSELSKGFQRDYVNFSKITSGIQKAKVALLKLRTDEDPINKLRADIDSLTNISKKLTFTSNCLGELVSLFTKYIDSLLQNIDDRFSDSVGILTAFRIFSPWRMAQIS